MANLKSRDMSILVLLSQRIFNLSKFREVSELSNFQDVFYNSRISKKVIFLKRFWDLMIYDSQLFDFNFSNNNSPAEFFVAHAHAGPGVRVHASTQAFLCAHRWKHVGKLGCLGPLIGLLVGPGC